MSDAERQAHATEGLTINAKPLKTVKTWICPDCRRPIGGLRVHADGCPRVGEPPPAEVSREEEVEVMGEYRDREADCLERVVQLENAEYEARQRAEQFRYFAAFLAGMCFCGQRDNGEDFRPRGTCTGCRARAALAADPRPAG